MQSDIHSAVQSVLLCVFVPVHSVHPNYAGYINHLSDRVQAVRNAEERCVHVMRGQKPAG